MEDLIELCNGLCFQYKIAIFDGKSRYFIFMKNEPGKRLGFPVILHQKTSISASLTDCLKLPKALKLLQKNLFLDNSFFCVVTDCFGS